MSEQINSELQSKIKLPAAIMRCDHGLGVQGRYLQRFMSDKMHIESIRGSSNIPLIHAICNVKQQKIQRYIDSLADDESHYSSLYTFCMTRLLENACNSAFPDSDVEYEPVYDMPEVDRHVEPIQNYISFVTNERFNILADKIARMDKESIAAEVSRIDSALDTIIYDMNIFAVNQLRLYGEALKLYTYQKIHERLEHVIKNPEDDVNSMDMTEFNKIAREIDDMEHGSVVDKYVEIKEQIERTVGSTVPVKSSKESIIECEIPERVSCEELEHSNIKELVHQLYVYEYYPSEMFELTTDRVQLDKYRAEHEPNYKSKYAEGESPRAKEIKRTYKVEGELKVPHNDILLHGRINTAVFFEHLNLKQIVNDLVSEALERKSAEENEQEKDVKDVNERECKHECCGKGCCRNTQCKHECCGKGCCKQNPCKHECCKHECCKHECCKHAQSKK